jgi:hypothetical protein
LWRKKPKQILWSARPEIIDEAHWKDLHAGALFFDARVAAFSILDKIEVYIGNLEDKKLELGAALSPQFLEDARLLKDRANAFLAMDHDPTPGLQARTFCRECLDEDHVIERLVGHDDRILRLSGKCVIPGPAFNGGPNVAAAADADLEGDDTQVQAVADTSLPKGISQRVHNMFRLNIDMQGKLNERLQEAQ